MNKKGIVILAALAFLLASCIFDSEEAALGTWLKDQGLPEHYKVQTLSVPELNPISAEVFVDTTPRSANDRAILGNVSNLTHDLVLDFTVKDSVLNELLLKSDSAKISLMMNLLQPFYNSKSFPKDSLPFKEDLELKTSWKITKAATEKAATKMTQTSDSSWYSDIMKWKADGEADTTYSISVSAKDSVVEIPLPNALIKAMEDAGKYYRLQLRLSVPKAERAYRFYGGAGGYPPALYVSKIGNNQAMFIWNSRMAGTFKNNETCTDCLVLHGGVFDSLVVEYPSAEIMKALSEFYDGDPFPYVEGDSNDVRQAVVLAQMTFHRDDSQGSQELGHPIQVVVGSYVDSADVQDRRVMEAYKLNKKLIVSEGHPNMIFHDGDSLSLQVTYGMRDFINRASDGRTFKMMMRMGYPVLQVKDSTYANYVVNGDSSYTFFGHFDYARYDFSTIKSSPSTLRLWLATKRGEE